MTNFINSFTSFEHFMLDFVKFSWSNNDVILFKDWSKYIEWLNDLLVISIEVEMIYVDGGLNIMFKVETSRV